MKGWRWRKNGIAIADVRPGGVCGLRAKLALGRARRQRFQPRREKHRLRLRPGRTGNALKMAEELGLKLEGTEAAHRVFSRNGWEIVIDFEKEELPDPV